MSCMIQNRENTSIIASFIAAAMNMGYEYTGFSYPTEFNIVFRDCHKDYRIDENLVYNKLRMLNYQAYECRYKHMKQHELNSENFIEFEPYVSKRIHEPIEWLPLENPGWEDYHYEIKPWHYQMKKYITFYIYQCSEDATDKTELYQAMKMFNNILTNFIVENAEEYRRLRWE